MLDRLWFRLLLGMTLALAVAVVSVAVLTRLATSESFADYVEDISTARSQRVDSVLTRQYQRRQSWGGVEPTVQLVADLSGQRAVLADSSGRVVADSQNELVGQPAQPSWAGDPVRITYQGNQVGSVYLDPLRPSNRVDSRGQMFLAVTNQYLVWAAAVGLLAALILSLLLSRWLAAPLEALTHAARRMASGDLSQRIDVRIGGEVGTLAEAFNATAASLARLEGLRQQMVADIAHELRTPLTSVRGYLEAIQDGVAEPDDSTLSVIQYELAQLTRLIDDLQELALVEAGQLALSCEQVDLADLVKWELQALRPEADTGGVALRADLPAELPDLWADGGRLSQVLRNILRNAVAHTPAGGQVNVSLALETGASFLLRIRDTGSGIPADDLPHIFERFYRADKSRARQGQGGYGLGLTISRGLIQAHGGQISATSSPHLGTEFTIRLPMVGSVAGREQQLPATEPLAAPPENWAELVRTGALVAALFGATAGLVESAQLAGGARQLRSFLEVAGYAVVLDALAFGLFGGLATLVALLAGRAIGRPLGFSRQVDLLAPIGCILVGSVAYFSWRLQNEADAQLAAPHLFAQVATFGVAAWLALLTGALLCGPRLPTDRALRFSRRWAPLTLAMLMAMSAVGIVHDLGGRGSGFAASSVTADSARVARASDLGASLTSKRPNVLLVTIDSLRADHVGAYGYANARTPTLDRLAVEGVRFSTAIANQPDANPSHAAIFSGTYPATNGVRAQMVDRLSDDVPTLADIFTNQGYQTAGLFSSLSFGPPFSGFDRGFQTYTDLSLNRPAYLADPRMAALAATYRRLSSMLVLPGAIHHQLAQSAQVEDVIDGRANVTADAAITWLREHQAKSGLNGQPFFLWVHFFDPHYPYTPPAPFDSVESDDCGNCPDVTRATMRQLESDRPDLSSAQVNRLLQAYDGEIAFTDRELGRLLNTLGSLGLDQNTLVVAVGDNGEAFGEHGTWLHGTGLYDEEVQVPLLMRLPGHLPAGKTVDQVAQQIDLLPTLVDLLGLPAPAPVDGRSLLPLVRDQQESAERFAVSELADRSKLLLVTGEWRLLKSVGDGRLELFRALDDPDNLHDLSDDEPVVTAELDELLESWRTAHP
jgi:signal transduction histidine kinase/arylsulfatase A-like enzyme